MPVPLYSAPCKQPGLNTTIVQVSLPWTGVNATALLSSANVWDAWSAAVTAQLARHTAIPLSQLSIVFAGQCPAPPLWMGNATADAFRAAPPIDCLTFEFVEVPASARALGLSARAALYRLACSIGASTDPKYAGAFLPQPLSASGITPATHLLGPLWSAARDPRGNEIDRLTVATWKFMYTTNLARGAAPSVIPGQIANLGRFDGRLVDLPYLAYTDGRPNYLYAYDNVPALKGFLGTFIVICIGLVAYIVYKHREVHGAVRDMRADRDERGPTTVKAKVSAFITRRLRMPTVVTTNPLKALSPQGGSPLAGSSSRSALTRGAIASHLAPDDEEVRTPRAFSMANLFKPRKKAPVSKIASA